MLTSMEIVESGGRVLLTAPRYLLLLIIVLISNNLIAEETTGGMTFSVDISPVPCSTAKNAGFIYTTGDAAAQACIDEAGWAGTHSNKRPDANKILWDYKNSSNNFVGNTRVATTCPNPNFLLLSQDPIAETCTYDTTCPSGGTYNPVTNTCEDDEEPPAQCESGETGTGTGPSTWNSSSPNVTVCQENGCEATWSMSVKTPGYTFYTTTTTGNECSEPDDGFQSSNPPPNLPPPLPDPLPASGGCVQDSQQVVCGDSATASPPVPDNGTSGQPAEPDAQQKDPVSGDTFNTYNNTTTNNSTNFTGESPNTGEEGDGASVGLGGIDTDGDGQGDCDPSKEDCGASNVSGGLNCSSPPQCEGDAILCAIRFQAWHTRCNLEDDTTDITEADVMSQLGQTQTVEEYFDHDNEDNIIDLDETVELPTPETGSCPADITVNTSIVSFTLPTQPICDIATLVRPAVIAITYLISGMMMFQGLIRTF